MWDQKEIYGVIEHEPRVLRPLNFPASAPGKGSVVVEEMVPDGMGFYAQICGQALARAHARSGDRVAIAAYLGKSDRFENAIADFAETCAEQNIHDHAELARAGATGRVIAETGI